MKNPTRNLITRESLLTTASYNTRWFASLVAGTAVLSASALAESWVGDTSSDWNNNLNWPGDDGNTGNATVNLDPAGTPPPYRAIISANATQPVVDIFVADGTDAVGRLDHTAGTANTGTGNWMYVGRGTGANSGTYNLADTSGTGGAFTGFATGSGSMNVGGTSGTGGRLYIGGYNGVAGTGVVNVNTTGTLTVRNDLVIGESGGNATFNMDAGTVNTGGWNFCGRGSTGTFRVSGGTLNNTGRFYFGDGGTGTGIQTGGTVTNNDQLWIGQGATGQGTYTLSGGTLSASGWVAIGRQGAQGVLNLSGTGTFTKQGNDNLIMGSDAANGKGTINQTGGTLNANNTMVVGAIASSEGIWNFSAGTGNVANLQIGNGGKGTLALSGTAALTATGTVTPGSAAGGEATVTLDGGSLTMPRMVGGAGSETVTFNGTQITATSAVLPFIESLDTATIGANGLLVNSGILNLSVPQIFGGTGGVVKTGTGSLTLSGVSSYAGNNTVSAGKLTLNASSTGTGNITVADNAGLGISQGDPANGLDPVNVSFGTTGNTLDINLGAVAGNPTAAPLNVTGTLTVNGTVTINVADQMPAVGTVPLISYVGSKAGGGNFVLGTLPNGVVATLNDNGTGLVSLNVTSASLPKWDGTNESGLTKSATTVEFSSDVTVTDATGIAIGQPVRGTGIPSGTTVLGISGTTITLSQGATASGTGVSLLFVTTAGTNEGVWDFVTENWIDQITNTSTLYADPSPVLFDDSATGPTAVTLNTTVAPSAVTFNNSTLTYSLSGTGKITGSTGLTKTGTGTVTVGTTNDHTGVTRFEGGTVSVGALTNGGVAGPLGAASNAASNLVFAGGTLDYTGGAVSIDRGLSVAASGDNVMSTVSVAGNVTTSGAVSTTLGKLTKDGAGTLTLTNAGANTIGNGSAGDAVPQSLRVANGGLAFSVAGQTNTVTGRTGFGTAAGNTTSVTLSNGATFTSSGRTQIGTADNTNVSLTVSGTSVFTSNDTVQTALNNGSVVNIVVENSGAFNKPGGGWMSIGNSANGVATMTVRDSGSLSTGGDFNVGDTNTANGTLNLEGNSNTTLTGGMFIGKNGTTGTVNVTGDANITTGITNVGGATTSDGNLNIKGTSNYISNGRLQVGPDAGGNGDVVIEESGSMVVNSYTSIGFNGHGSMLIKGSGSFNNTDDFSINESGDAAVTVTVQDNGSLSMTRTLFIGRNGGRTGTLNAIGAAVVNQVDAAYSLIVGPAGTGNLTIDDTATVTAAANSGLVITNNASGTGIVNLDGGTLTVKKVSDAGGNSTFHFNGGVLKAAAGADVNFLGGLNTLDVKAAGAFIDSNGQTIAISQGIADAGGNVTKRGAGTLQLNASNPYIGTTTVEAGALGGTGSVGGELLVPTGSTIAPGAAGVGTFTVEDALGSGSTIGGTYVCEINGATSDKVAYLGDLTLQAGSTLDIDVLSAPTAGAFIIASYGSLTGTFTTVSDLPAGYVLDYNYQGLKQIALVQTASPYSTWASSYGLDPLTDGAPGVDKDGDGQNNSVEFALGGSPISGSNNAKIYSLAADSDADVDTTKELVLTIAVRSGTPAFTGSPSPTATMDGYTYTIQGSTSLGGFTDTVTPTTAPVTTGLPAAPAGYEYRSFSLSGSNGVPTKGFMRVLVTP